MKNRLKQYRSSQNEVIQAGHEKWYRSVRRKTNSNQGYLLKRISRPMNLFSGSKSAIRECWMKIFNL